MCARLIHPGVCAAREHGVPSSPVSQPHSLGQGLSPNLELITSATVAGLGASEICLSLLPVLVLQVCTARLKFYVGAGDLNSGPYTYLYSRCFILKT